MGRGSRTPSGLNFLPVRALAAELVCSSCQILTVSIGTRVAGGGPSDVCTRNWDNDCNVLSTLPAAITQVYLMGSVWKRLETGEKLRIHHSFLTGLALSTIVDSESSASSRYCKRSPHSWGRLLVSMQPN